MKSIPAKTHDSAQELFTNYYRLVPYITGRMTQRSSMISDTDRDDIISRTYLMLWEICLKQSQNPVDAFKGYVYIRIKGTIIDELRKKKKIYDQAIFYADYLTNVLSESCSSSAQIIHTEKLELQAQLSQALSQLNPKEQVVISEFYLQEKRFCQIARDHQGMSKSWISKIHRQALKKLKVIVIQPSE